MLGVHEMCKRKFQRKNTIMKPGKLRIRMYRYIVHTLKCFRGIFEEMRALEGTLLEGGQEEGQRKYGHNAV